MGRKPLRDRPLSEAERSARKRGRQQAYLRALEDVIRDAVHSLHDSDDYLRWSDQHAVILGRASSNAASRDKTATGEDYSVSD
jgi:hypothetical protein